MLTLRGIFITCLIIVIFSNGIERLYEPSNFSTLTNQNDKLEERRQINEKTFYTRSRLNKHKKQSSSSIIMAHGSSNLASPSLCREINITQWRVGRVVCTQLISTHKQPTITTIELQSLNILNQIQKISKDMPLSSHSLLIATQSAFQSVIRMLSEGMEESLKTIQTLVFIDANLNFAKDSNIEQFFFAQKNRRQAMKFKNKLQFVLIFTNPALKKSLTPYLLLENLPCSYIVISSLELWNIYQTFQSSRELLISPMFQDLMNQMALQLPQSSLTLKQIHYWLSYGEHLNKLSTYDSLVALRDQMDKKCRDQPYYTFSEEGQTLKVYERCVAIKVLPQTPDIRSLSFIMKSNQPLNVSTKNREYVPPYLIRHNLSLYLWEKLTHMPIVIIYNPHRSQIHMNLCRNIVMDAQTLKGSVYILQNVRIVKLPNIPLRVCPSDSLMEISIAQKDQCFEGQSLLIVKSSIANLTISLNSREILRRLCEQHETLHGRMLFLTTIMLRIQSLPLALVTLVILVTVGCIVQPQVHPFYIVMYTFLMVGVGSILNSIINNNDQEKKEDEQEQKKQQNQPSIINNILFLSPNILCVCTWVGLDLPVQLQWICLLLAHLPIKNKLLTPLNLYLFYLNLHNVKSGQLTYHYYLLLLWLYLQPSIDQLCVYEINELRSISLKYCVLLITFVTEDTAIVLFLVEVMALQVAVRAAWLGIRKQLMLTSIHRRLKRLL